MSPLISEFDGLKVRMNELDHEPTHVHVVYQGKSVFVDTDAELEEPPEAGWHCEDSAAVLEVTT